MRGETYNKWFWVLAIVAIGAAAYKEYWEVRDHDHEHEWMGCQTAKTCAQWLEFSYSKQTPLDSGDATLVDVTANGNEALFVYTLSYGKEETNDDYLAAFESHFRGQACEFLHHEDFVSMGGVVIHRYVFPTGETMREIRIDEC